MYAMRYSNGGIDLDQALTMDRHRLLSINDALEALIREENRRPDKPRDEDDDE